jgi:hypothetical protein
MKRGTPQHNQMGLGLVLVKTPSKFPKAHTHGLQTFKYLILMYIFNPNFQICERIK